MSNDEWKSPPMPESNVVVKIVNVMDCDKKKPSTIDAADITDIEIISNNSDPDSSINNISFSIVPPFKFAKTVSTDNIVNVDPNSVEFNSFHYVKKDILITTLLFMIIILLLSPKAKFVKFWTFSRSIFGRFLCLFRRVLFTRYNRVPCLRSDRIPTIINSASPGPLSNLKVSELAPTM